MPYKNTYYLSIYTKNWQILLYIFSWGKAVYDYFLFDFEMNILN